MSDETTIEEVATNPDVKPAKKVTKKKTAKKVEKAIPCDDCMSRNICRAQGWCRRG